MNFSPTQIIITYMFFQYLSFFTLWMEHNKLKNELAERTSSMGSCEGKKFHPPQQKPVDAPALGENEKLQRALERMRKSRTECEDKRNSRQTQIVRR